MRERDRCVGGGGQYLCRGKDIRMWQYNYTDELYHYGCKGMEKGIHILTKKVRQYIRIQDLFREINTKLKKLNKKIKMEDLWHLVTD